jgi:phosphoglycerol transferase
MRDSVREVARYAVAVVVSVLVMYWALQLRHLHWHVPLCYQGDGILCQMWIKGILVRGWYLENPDLGAPLGQQMYDFPLADTLHFAILKLLGSVVRDAGTTFNLYYLLTFPLTTLTSLFVLRRLRVAYPVALVAALLYAFLPFHFLRLAHYFLALYYLVPLVVLVVLRVYDGRLSFRRDEEDGRWSLPLRWLGAVATCVLIGMGGIYYAFFACFFLLVAGLAAVCSFRRRTAPAAALLLTLVVCVAVGTTLAPPLVFKLRHGPNPDAVLRGPWESEVYGLKITQLLLPVDGHRLARLAHFTRRYNVTAPLVNENSTSALGLVGGSGFLLVLAWLLFRRRASGGPDFLDGVAACTAAAVLLATVGGFGSLFAYLTTPYIRGYNRMTVYLGFFALCGLAGLLQRAWQRFGTTLPRRAAFGVFLAALLAVGLLDQVSPAFVPPYAWWQRDYREDEDFARRIEAVVPAGALVYQLPYMPFPEVGTRQGLVDYDLFRPYLHAHGLRWSYGAMKGRPADDWQHDLEARPLAERLSLLALADCGGVYVDRAGYADRGAAVEADLGRLLGVPPLVSSSGRFAFFDVAAHSRAVREQGTADEWRARRDRLLHPLTFAWTGNWYEWEEPAPGVRFRWCAHDGELIVRNPSTYPRAFTLQLTCDTPGPKGWPLAIRGDCCTADLTIDGQGQSLTREVTVPPGRHALHFHCTRPALHPPGDERELVFRVVTFSSREEF